MTQKLKILLITLALLPLVGYLVPSTAKAAPCTPSASNPSCVCSSQGCDDGTTPPKTICDSSNLTAAQLKSCQACNSTNPALDNCLQNNVIIKDLQIGVNFLSALVGIVVIGTIILGGTQYAMAGGSPDAVAKAKKRVTDGLIAFAIFLFIFVAVQWLIPGSIFG